MHRFNFIFNFGKKGFSFAAAISSCQGMENLEDLDKSSFELES